MTDVAPQQNPRKIRMGLALITVVFVASVVLMFVVSEPIGRAIFFAVAVVALVRVVSLVRWLRRQSGSTNR